MICDTQAASDGPALRAVDTLTEVDADAPEPVSWLGRYVLGAKLGEGGMSIVHEAYDLLLRRTIAIKVPKSSLDTPVVTEEARLLAAVDHPSVVRVHAVYPDATPPFIVMERVLGRTLSRLLEDGRLPVRRALRILRQVAAGVDALHDAGIVHGDLKPANVIVGADDDATIIDVGLAPLLERMRPGEILGTPSYMAPERALAQETVGADLRSGDVYSFGVLSFQLLTGDLPFHGPSPFLLYAQAFEAPPVASDRAPLNKQFDAPLAGALSKRAKDRPTRCGALVDALDRAAGGSDVDGQRLRVVVADDDCDQRELLTYVLGVHLPGAELVVCETVRSAIDALAEGNTAVAVLDLTMPDGCGLEIVRRVRELSPRTAIVIVTGGGSGSERAAARELGVRRFLVKPVEIDELVSAIRDELSRACAVTS